jgi:LacI family transcriptional regulator
MFPCIFLKPDWQRYRPLWYHMGDIPMSTAKKLPTIREVAETAQVSISTVSNVLHGKHGFYSAETAERVWQAVKQLGYRPNHIARSLACQRTFTIGIVVETYIGNVSHNPYFGFMLDGILHGASLREYQVKIVRVPVDNPEKAMDYIADGSVDGVVLVALFVDSPVLPLVAKSGIPAVVAGSAPPAANLPCVDVDDVSAIRRAVHWLVELGHRRIGLITGDMRQWSARRRQQGYLLAMHELGIKPEPAWCYEGDYRLQSGQTGIEPLLRAEPPLTAVICSNDKMAVGALKMLNQLGVKVPQDLSLIGFDDAEESAIVSPALTTFRQPVFEIGLKAAELLLQQIETGTPTPHNLLLPAELVVRQTVAPPPRDEAPVPHSEA